MSAQIPDSLLTTEELLKIGGFRRDRADHLDDALSEWFDLLQIVSVKDYGALGNGIADDTAAVNAAIAAIEARRVAAGSVVLGTALYFPAGAYRITSTIALPSYITIKGESRNSTTLRWSGSAAVGAKMFDLTNKYSVGIQDLQVKIDSIVSGPNTITLFYLSNAFRCTWHRVTLTGNHTVSTPDPQSTGIEFVANAGDNRMIDCDINGLGKGVRAAAIMNYAVGCVFGTNKYGIIGDSNDLGAGFCAEACTFVGTGVDGTGGTAAHVACTGNGNMWRLVGCWIEGCRVGVQIGSGAAGPATFGIIGCKIAAVDTGIDVIAGANAFLSNVLFGTDSTGTPSGSHNDILINSTNAPTGTAIGLMRSDGFDVDPEAFPAGWTLFRRGAGRLPELIDVTHPLVFGGDSSVTFNNNLTVLNNFTAGNAFADTHSVVGTGSQTSSPSSLAANSVAWQINRAGTFDTSGGTRISTGLVIGVSSTESPGGGTMVNRGILIDVSGGDSNTALLVDRGDVLLGNTSGNTTVNGNLTTNGNNRFGNAAGDLVGFYTTAGSAQQALVALTDNSGGTANDTVQALPDPADTPASADALRDDLVANLIPALRNNIADLTAKVNALRTILLNLGIIA